MICFVNIIQKSILFNIVNHLSCFSIHPKNFGVEYKFFWLEINENIF